MLFDFKVFKAVALNKDKFNYEDLIWNIQYDPENKILRVSNSIGDQDISSKFFKRESSNCFILKDKYSDFNDRKKLTTDSIYKVLSTLAFDWKYKILLYSILSDSKIKLSKSMNKIKSEDKELYSIMSKLIDCYELSPLMETVKSKLPDNLEGDSNE